MKGFGIACGLMAAVALAGCSHSGEESKAVSVTPDADSGTASVPHSARIVCYAGKDAVYSGTSTPEMQPSFDASGVRFRDAKTGHFMHISGTCIVEYQD